MKDNLKPSVKRLDWSWKSDRQDETLYEIVEF